MRIAAALFALALPALALPVAEMERGMFRIYNPDPVSYYCWVGLNDGRTFEGMLYPGNVTPWYLAANVSTWGCK